MRSATGAAATALERARHPALPRLVRVLLLAAVADRSGGARATGVRHWLKYNIYGLGLPPIQHLSNSATTEEKLEAEMRLMNFVVWLVTCMPSGRTISVESARKYVGQVISWMRRVHASDFAGDLQLRNLKDMIRGMRRELGERPKVVRWGCRTQQLREAMDRCLPRGSSRDAQMWRAALAVAFCGLLRGGEIGLPDGVSFSALYGISHADLRFLRRNGKLVAAIKLHVLKGKVLTGKTVTVFLESGGTLLDPVLELLEMLRLDPVDEALRAETPLFCIAGGEAITRRDVASMVKALMQAIGLDPARFGAHSLRIGGATAALAAGVPPTLIRVAGRWASDVFEIYTRLSMEAAAGMACIVGSTPFQDVEQGEFVSEELEALPFERAAMAHVDLDPESDGGADSDDEL